MRAKLLSQDFARVGGVTVSDTFTICRWTYR